MTLKNIMYNTWDLPNLIIKFDFIGLDLMKLLYWKATTGRGYKRRVRVCSLKFPSIFFEVRNCTIVIRVATSTESTSLPYMRGLNDLLIMSK